jgi:hypothetical protein
LAPAYAYLAGVRVPIACTLNQDDARSRIDEWRAALHDSVTATTRVSTRRLDLRLADGPDHAGRLVDLARRETECCRFFSFTVEIDAEGATLVVQVPEDAGPVLDDFAALRT